jgi:hypothetical protein
MDHPLRVKSIEHLIVDEVWSPAKAVAETPSNINNKPIITLFIIGLPPPYFYDVKLDFSN